MHKKEQLRKALVWLGVSAFCGLVPVIYYSFSHGLTSPLMTFLFVYPLVLDLYYWVILLAKKPSGPLGDFFLGAGTGTLLSYLTLKAIYDMAETKNGWLVSFLVLAIVELLVGFIVSVVRLASEKEDSEAVSA
jgi:hypothetical protein